MSYVTALGQTLSRAKRPLLCVGSVGVLAAGVLLASSIAREPVPSGAATVHSGPVNVLYAGSLLDLMQGSIDGAFHQASGYTVSGYSDGSAALASEIKGRTRRADVFISASPSADATLVGTKNGNWVNMYKVFATSPLVLGYNPSSAFVKDLKAETWYSVVGRAGFRLGRTDPLIDPKGVLAVKALDDAAKRFHVPALRRLVTASSNVFPETTLVGRLQSGQIDAGFFYSVEASAAHIKSVPLTGTHLAGEYTVAIINRAPHEAAAKSFVRFLLSAQGRQLLERRGVTPLVPPKVVTNVG